MSVIRPITMHPLQFYRSSPAPCPYLQGRIERKLFTRLDGDRAGEINSVLSHAGFRRSHDIIYKPTCPGCSACVAVRVPVSGFKPNRRQRKIMSRGRHFVFVKHDCVPDRSIFDLFLNYQQARHVDSDMAAMSYDDFRAMMVEGQANTSAFMLSPAPSAVGPAIDVPADGTETAAKSAEVEGKIAEDISGVMLADRLDDGWSAVYSFFDIRPEAQRNSLGTLMILRLIEQAQADGLPYVYLGYFVRKCQKMDYKSQFRPLEVLGADGWAVLEGE